MSRLLFLFFFVQSAFCQEIKIFAGSASSDLAKEVASLLNLPLSEVSIGRFNDGEIRIKIEEDLHGACVYLIQSTCLSEGQSVNDNWMELYLMIRTLKRASAEKVTAVIPYYGYGRQDRRSKEGVPISASDVAMLLELAGADQVIAIDLHCGQIQGFFHRAPVDNLSASSIFIPHLRSLHLSNVVVVSPDAGGVERAKAFIENLQAAGIPASLAVIVKQRAEAGVIESMHLVGTVSQSTAILIDDICDTAGTLVEAAKTLQAHGATRVLACVTHPLLSGPACSRIAASCLEECLVTNTIPLRCPTPSNLIQLSVAPLLAEAIKSGAIKQEIRY